MKTFHALGLGLLALSLMACSNSSSNTESSTQNSAADQQESTTTSDTTKDSSQTDTSSKTESSKQDTTNTESTTTSSASLGDLEGYWYPTTGNGPAIKIGSDGSINFEDATAAVQPYYFGDDEISSISLEANGNLTLNIVNDDDFREVLQKTSDTAVALRDDDYYFLDKDGLIIDEIQYSREQAPVETPAGESVEVNAIAGTWNNKTTGTQINFNEDGSINGLVWHDEQATKYEFQGENLILTITEDDGEIDTESFARTDDAALAQREDDVYYLDSNQLILDEVVYNR